MIKAPTPSTMNANSDEGPSSRSAKETPNDGSQSTEVSTVSPSTICGNRAAISAATPRKPAARR